MATGTIPKNLAADVNTLNSNINNLFSVKTASIALGTVAGSDIVTIDYSVSSNPANYGFVVGWLIQSNTNVVPLRIYMPSKNTISVRGRNISTSSTSGAILTVYYI